MKKLKLKKQIIASLSDEEKQAIVGGDAWTTSISNCTHFICCGEGCETSPPIKSIWPNNCYSFYPNPC